MAKLELNVVAGKAISESKRLKAELDRLKRSAKGAEDGLDDFGRSSDVAAGRFKNFGLVAKAGFAAAAAGLVAFSAKGISAYRDQNAALSEVSTLIEGTAEEIDALDDASRRFASAYGGSATTQVEAFYQAISAGVGDVADATDFLDTANRLAVAGVTDITTSVDLLSSALNVYGAEGLTAAQASDQLFLAVKAGKTNISELGSSLGKVLPVAQSAGVGFDEVAASVAALTTGGLSTAEAVTSVRATLATVLKPTKEAADLAEQLGIDFSVAGLEAKGFAGFMEEVIDKTGGSTDQLAKLFAGQEALVGVLALSSGAGEKFAETLEDMQTAAGTTEEAFRKIDASLSQRLNKVLATTANAAIAIGEALLTVLVPAAEVVIQAFQFLSENTDILIASMVGLGATAIPSAVVGLGNLAAGINLAAGGAKLLSGAAVFLRGALSLLGGPLGITVGLLSGAATYLAFTRDKAGEADTAAREFALGMDEVNTALGTFNSDKSANAATNLVNVSNKLVENAEAAFEAARAQRDFNQARREAFLQAAATGDEALSFGLGGISSTAEGSRRAAAQVLEQLEQDRLAIEAAEDALQEAREKRLAALRQITSAGEIAPGDGTTLPALNIDVPPIDLPPIDTSATVDGLNDVTDAYEELRAELFPLVAATNEYDAAMAILNDRFPEAADRGEEYAAAQEVIAARLRQAKIEASNLATEFGQTAAAIITGASSAKDAIGGLVDSLANAALQNGLSALFSFAFPSGSGVSDFFGAILGGNARGTNAWSGGPTVVGEEGPEIVDLPSGTKIHSASQSRSMMQEQGGVTFNIDARGAVEGVAEQIRKEMGRMVPMIRAESYATIKDASRRGY